MVRGGAVVLPASDLGRAVRFYVETLGMKLVEERTGEATIDAGEGFHIELRAANGATIAPGAAAIVFYPKVPIEDAIAVYENRGVTFDVERSESTVVAHFRDPDGHSLALVASR